MTMYPSGHEYEDRGSWRIHQFDSMTSFLDYVEPPATHRSYLSSRQGAGSFEGGATWNETVTMAREGWREMHGFADGIVGQLESRIAQSVQTMWTQELGVTGTQLDYDRFMADDPECVYDWTLAEDSGHNPVVRILISTGARAPVDSRAIKHRGAAVAAMVELIGLSGRTVEIWGESTATSGDLTHTTLVKIKDSASNLDLDQLMFALAHPGYHRRLVFSCREHETGSWGDSFGYGGSIEPQHAGRVDATLTIETIKPGQNYIFSTVDGTVEWTLNQLRQLGIIIGED